MKKLLSIGIDRSVFDEGSAVRKRFIGYAKEWDEIHLIVASDRSFSETAIGDNVWVYPTRSAFKALYPLDAKRLGRFIIERRGITHITCQDPFFTGMAGVALKKETGLPLELQIHTDIGSPNYARTLGNKIRKSLAISYLPQADAVRVVSERIKRYLVQELKIREDKISVRPIPVDTEAIKAAPITVDLHKKYPQFSRIVLMASRLSEEKNIESAVRAWGLVQESRAAKAIPGSVGLVIVGSGPRRQAIESLVQKLGIAESVAIEPWADLPVLYSYYKTADLFLSVSLFEGYGMTLVEARAAGCKVVSTDVGVAREAGAAIAGWSPEEIARGISSALGL